MEGFERTLHEVTAAQLTVDRKFEQSKFADMSSKFKADTNGPDVPRLQWEFLANKTAIISWDGTVSRRKR